MTTTQQATFATLLDAWNEHQRLRTAGATPAELIESRSRLDCARRHAFVLTS